jgi:uncharacterized protein YecE (DUF72 family)
MLEHLKPLADKGKLGPILLQLPPNLQRDNERLAEFLPALSPSYRWAIEFRHDSWHHASVENLLRRFNIAWAAAETDTSDAECRDTADFLYVRLRRSQYSTQDLRKWGRYFLGMRKDCYVYCKHEDEGSPWIWADDLLKITASDSLSDGNHG